MATAKDLSLKRKNKEIALAQINPEYVDTEGAAKLTGWSKQSFERWRTKMNGGPPFYKFDQKILYKLSELNEWFAQHRCVPSPNPESPYDDPKPGDQPRPWDQQSAR